MFVRKEKQLTKKTKSTKQLQQSRKKTFNARKKAIRLQQLRWLRRATSEQLPLILNTPSALKQLYLSASGKLSIERKFNLLLTQYRKQEAQRFSRATSRLTIRAKWDSSVKNSPKDKHAFFKTNYSPAVFAQKRRKFSAVNKLYPTPASKKSALLTKRLASRRRYLRKCGPQLSLLIHNLLLRRTARKLSFRIATAKRFIRDKGQRRYQVNTLITSNKSYILASARQGFKQLSSAARTAAALDRAAADRKQPCPRVGNSYQQMFNRATLLAKKLKVLKVGIKHLRTPAPVVRRARVVNLYSQTKESLRSRFFARKILTSLLTKGNPLLAPRGTRTNLYTRSTKKQAFPHAVLPLSRKLATVAIRFRLQQVMRSTRKIPTFSKQSAKPLPFLKRLPRRSKRVLAVTRRASKKLGKGAQIHSRFASLRPKLSKQAPLILSKKPTAGRAIGWRRSAGRFLRGKFLAGSGLLTVFSRTATPAKKANTCSMMGRTRRPLRIAMWALLRAIKFSAARLAIAAPHEYAVIATMARKLRRGLRRSGYNADEILPNFLVLLKILVSAPVEQKKLYLSFQRWQNACLPPVALSHELRPQLAGTTFRTRVAAIRGRCQLRSGLSFKVPRLLALPLPTPAITATTAGRKLVSDQTVPYMITPVAASDSAGESTKELYTPLRDGALALADTHQKKRLLPQIARRRARFSRFIPQRAKSRLLRNSAVASNKIAPMSTRLPVERYSRQFYIKGNRIFAARHKRSPRVAAKRVVSQSRWSRATLLRLNCRRPVWRRLPQVRHLRSSTGRAVIVKPITGSSRGWRARKNRIKQHAAFRARAERFKALVYHTRSPYLPSVLSGQRNLPPRVLKLTAAADPLGVLLDSGGASTVLAVPALHTAQQQMTAQRAVRAIRANSVFTRSVLRVSGGAYKRRKGRFLLVGNKKRKFSRRPRWVRLLSKALTPTLNLASLSPQLISAANSGATFSAKATTLQLRDRLWASVGRYRRVPNLKMKTLGQVPGINFEQTKLIKKLRRLSLFKKLLQGNKLGKLARLGALNALGEYKHLGNLSSLAVLGPISGELKQQLLLQLATDIKFCASLCATHTAVQQHPAVTTRVSTRALLARKPRVSTPDHDQTFFHVEIPKKRVTRALKVRKLTLLRGLAQVKTKRVPVIRATSDGFNPLFVRIAKTKRAAAALRLHRYRRTLSRVGDMAHFNGGRSTPKGLQWNSAQSTDRSVAQKGNKAYPARISGVKTIKNPATRFIPLHKLPSGYKKILNTVVVPQTWIGLLGRWTRRIAATSPRTRNQTLPKIFSTTRPWGVKTLYSGHIGKNYSRLLAGVQTEFADLKGVTHIAARKVKTVLPLQLLPARLAAARAVFAHRLPKTLHFTAVATSNKFWHLRPLTRDHVRTRAEHLLRALALVHTRKFGRVIKTAQPRVVTSRTNTKQVKIPSSKQVVAAPALKLDFVGYHIKGLNITVFDQSVRKNLQQFSNLRAEERAGTKGYDFARRAYKAALSSQERNPKLPQPQFELQKAAVTALITKLTGIAPGGDVLELKQFPKNKATTQTAALPASYATNNIATSTPGNLTVAEIESIRDETTRKNLKIFIRTNTTERLRNDAYLLVKRAVLHSWTKVEEEGTPQESPFYNDLLLAAKAYSFYGVTLDLSSRAATNTKLAPTFAKLPK